MELIAAPGIVGVAGRIELSRPEGPFTVAVTPAGRLRYRLILTVSGLPAAESLGRFRAYVAWAATPAQNGYAEWGEMQAT